MRKAFIVPGRRIISGLRSRGATHFRHKHTRTPSAAPVRCPFSITVRVLTGPTREKTGPERGPRRDADGFDDPRTPQRRPRRGISRCVSRRGAGRQDQEPDGGVLRPRQDHRPDHLLRGRGRRDGAVRRAPDDAAGVLFAPADREPADHDLRRGRRGHAREQIPPGLHGLDVRLEPRPPRHRARDLRHLADGVQRRAGGHRRGEGSGRDARSPRPAATAGGARRRSRRRRFRPPACRRTGGSTCRRHAAFRCSRPSSRPAASSRRTGAAVSIPAAGGDFPYPLTLGEHDLRNRSHSGSA